MMQRVVQLLLAVCVWSLATGNSAMAGGGLDELHKPRAGQAGRASSADPNWRDGNNDRVPIPPGQTVTLADIEGPAVIRHIWMTLASDDPRCNRAFVLRIYWDGAETPAVESPLGDFFGVGHGVLAWVDSMPVAVTSDGKAYNCYWPMPFRERARITLTNDSSQYASEGVYYYVDYETQPRMAENQPYFHAQYRQEYPARKGNYLICDLEGQGHYVGTVLSVQTRTQHWFGEGDDLFTIDGARLPNIRGTGTEDYFCDAWGFRELMRPYYGVTIMEGFDVGDRATVFRWHVMDPIPFRESLRFEIEHKGIMYDQNGDFFAGHYERPDLFSSVAYWYQTGQAKRFTTLPPLNQRIVPTTRWEMEDHLQSFHSRPKSVTAELQAWHWINGQQAYFDFDEPTSQARVALQVDEPMAGPLRVRMTGAQDYGSWEISLTGNDVEIRTNIDLYRPYPQAVEAGFGYVELEPGTYTLAFECTGKNGDSAGYRLGVDRLELEHIERFRVPVRTRKQEQGQ